MLHKKMAFFFLQKILKDIHDKKFNNINQLYICVMLMTHTN